MATKTSRRRKRTFKCKSKPRNKTLSRSHPARSPRSQCTVTGNLLERLPLEVVEMVLDKLSVVEISVFSMVSKETTRYIMDYISTIAWKKKVLGSFHPPSCLGEESTIEHYRDLGLLFKRCTLLLPTKQRLNFVFSKFSKIPCFMINQCLAESCCGFATFGVFLQTLIAGWDEMECHRVFSFLCDHTNLPQRVEAVITGKPGMKWYLELQVRLFCRQVLLDPWPNEQERQFWLTLLLKPWPMVCQAHLLFILYGPLLSDGTVGWLDVVERGVPCNALWDLSRAILLLVGKIDVNDQANHSMLAILEELIVIPHPWHLENVARLMVLCGSNFCCTVICNRAINSRLPEISRLMMYIILVCEKDGFHMSWAVKLVEQACTLFNTGPEKYHFIQELENMFSVVIREIFGLSVADQFEDRETFQNLCVVLSSIANFHTRFLHMHLQ
ncbi:F-box only protein 47-like [Antennarius striatus]|uniref:F-box only protein 47-like n=1 Tax=Antennarius striatus TaxID=241820 RepID=UPI0035ADCEEF